MLVIRVPARYAFVSSSMLLKALTSSWFAALLLQAILAGILVFKKMWKRFPFFVAYSVTSMVSSISLYALYLASVSLVIYSRLYWLNEGIGLFLGLAVVWEIFRHLLDPYPALKRLAAQIFRGALVFLILLGCIVIYAQPHGDPNRIRTALFVMEQAGRILEVGLLLFLFLFASAFGLHWRQYVFGIALGLGLFVTVELVAVTMRVQFGSASMAVFKIARTLSYNSSLFIWIAYILAPELATSPIAVPKRAQLEQWNQAIMELIYQ